MKEIQLSEHFSYRKLLRFTLPSIVMMVFSSMYSVVDGIFVSNFVGKTPFAAINLIMPFLMMFAALGFMFGTGGSALVAKTLGEGNRGKANGIFSMLVYILIAAGMFLSFVGTIYIRDIALWLGADENMIEDCVAYALILLPVLPAFILQNAFQAFLVTAERPNMGLAITVAAGLTNIFLDFLFIAVFDWGLAGAAWATAISQSIGGIVPLVYFALPNKSPLRLTKYRFDGKALFKVCTNGFSELLTNISMSVVTMLYNFQLMKYIGENGVAAFGVIMYVNFIFLSVYLGYSIGSAPIVSYNYGAQNHYELKNMLRKSLTIIAVLGFVLTGMAECLAPLLADIFVGYDIELYALTRQAFMLYSLSFLIAGFNIYASAFFTALNNGFVSAGISFSRTLIFETSAVLLLPLLFGINGIWLSIVVAEMAALTVSIILLLTYRKRYCY
ncbi:MATE family efflux transporter [Parabacteroides merdae]|uniref:Multidrug export protein MepA n=1 Tax=Parabacteroides merdae TaxID=46503 RepID=A0A7K1HC85_9BACT|nr:MATE family efflux transporter [Parabacteroides merdae]MTU28790.1 MATE family efflux transporter [Parabacteroides merdae]RYS85300.1 MATE family efflux transporter [Parabacteroides merdae]